MIIIHLVDDLKGYWQRRNDDDTEWLASLHLLLKSRDPGPKKSSWQQKHVDFVNTIRAARGIKIAMERGEPLPPPPPPTYNPGGLLLLLQLFQCTEVC